MRSLTLVLLLAVASSALIAPIHAAADESARRVERIQVPFAKTKPKVDGVAGATEWKTAVRVRIDDNTHALLQHDGNFLYVAIVSRIGGTASICTTNGGSDVQVLHASAALGSAGFELKDEKWTMTRGFTWTNRDTGESSEAMADRKKFLSSQQWFANATPYYSLEREYQLRVTGRTEIPLTMAFLSFKAQNDSHIHFWPNNLEDSCADRDLAGGWEDGLYTFAPETWGVAVLK
jgi:hypothetical protein